MRSCCFAQSDVKKRKLNVKDQPQQNQRLELFAIYSQRLIGKSGPEKDDHRGDTKPYRGSGKHPQAGQTYFNCYRIGTENNTKKYRIKSSTDRYRLRSNRRNYRIFTFQQRLKTQGLLLFCSVLSSNTYRKESAPCGFPIISPLTVLFPARTPLPMRVDRSIPPWS